MCQDNSAGNRDSQYLLDYYPTISSGGPRQECSQVPRQNCQQVPEEKCSSVPRQQCQPVQRQVPRQQCTDSPQQQCRWVSGQHLITCILLSFSVAMSVWKSEIRIWFFFNHTNKCGDASCIYCPCVGLCSLRNNLICHLHAVPDDRGFDTKA